MKLAPIEGLSSPDAARTQRSGSGRFEYACYATTHGGCTSSRGHYSHKTQSQIFKPRLKRQKEKKDLMIHVDYRLALKLQPNKVIPNCPKPLCVNARSRTLRFNQLQEIIQESLLSMK
jgi:hypothetical protein